MMSFAKAQDSNVYSGYYGPKQYYTISYGMAVPLGDIKDFISKTSFKGASFDAQIFVADNVAVGLNVGWSQLYGDVVNSTFYDPSNGFAMNAYNYKYVDFVPMRATAFYHLNPDGIVQPYLGIGIGTNYMQQHIVIQELDYYSHQWGFLLAPEVGTFIRFGQNSNIGAHISASYLWSTNKFDFNNKSYKNFQALQVNVGLSFMLF